MIAKILIITAFLVLLMYVLLPKRVTARSAASAGGRTFIVLCLAAVALLSAAGICVAFWLGSVSAGSAGNRVLLPMAAVLLVLALACGLAALFKRSA